MAVGNEIKRIIFGRATTKNLTQCIPIVFTQKLVASPLVVTSRSAVNLSHKIFGVGTAEPPQPPIFLFHGVLGNKAQWESVGKILMNITRRTVVTVDLRNHGDSPHANSHKYLDLAEDVLSLFDKLGATQASLIGHNIGGRTAMCVALIEPEKVAGLVVVDISPISTPSHYLQLYSSVLRTMGAIDFKKAKLNNESKAQSHAKQKLKPLITDDFFMNAILSNIKRKSGSPIQWICNLDVLIKDYDNWMSFPDDLKQKTYYGPTLFIGGQFSEFIPPDDLNRIRDLFPQAVITYVPKAGHHVHHDNTHTFLEITFSRLKTHVYNESSIKKL